MGMQEITAKEVTESLKNTVNWKSPGVDGIQNFWLKKFTSLHGKLAFAYNQIIDNPDLAPLWLTEGVTYLLPKNEDTHLPKNYRPITCLPTTYKNMTSIVSNRIYDFLSSNNVMPAEQKGCVRGSYGCKDHLLLSKAVMEDSKKRKTNMRVAWIDYKKAFDSVPHSWILQVLSLYHINSSIVTFCERIMKQWKTKMMLHSEGGTIISGDVKIRRGIFQGDSLSPLLFCMCLFPLSTELNRSGFGYGLKANKQKVNHLLYMDDLKLFAKNDEELEGLLWTSKLFSDDIQMDFGLDKCAKLSIVAGRVTKKDNVLLNDLSEIQNLEVGQTYKYLGVEEGNNKDCTTMKEKVSAEYKRRVK